MKVTNSAYEPSGPDQARAYPSFFNMKWLGVLLLPPGWHASPYSCSKVERHCESKVSWTRTQYNVLARHRTRLLDMGTSAPGRRPLHLPLLTKWRIVKYIIIVKSSSIPGTMLPCYKLLNIWMSDHCRALCVLNTRGMTQISTLYI